MSPEEEVREPSVKSVSAKKDHYSVQKSTGKTSKPIRTYQNLDEDPMLMLERDNSNEALRILGGSTRKEERKKPTGFNQRKMTYQQPIPELQMEDSFQTMPDDLEQMDQILETLSIEIQALGFPDCGNLRSTKRKDVKLRIKCFQAMLKHRKRDLEYRDGIQERQKKTEVDSQALVDKLARKEAKIQNIDKDRYLLKNQIKEKEDEIRAIKNAQKSTIRDKQANHTQVE